jgi:hypothetical protein
VAAIEQDVKDREKEAQPVLGIGDYTWAAAVAVQLHMDASIHLKKDSPSMG